MMERHPTYGKKGKQEQIEKKYKELAHASLSKEKKRKKMNLFSPLAPVHFSTVVFGTLPDRR
jgi:hypothetical protein